MWEDSNVVRIPYTLVNYQLSSQYCLPQLSKVSLYIKILYVIYIYIYIYI